MSTKCWRWRVWKRTIWIQYTLFSAELKWSVTWLPNITSIEKYERRWGNDCTFKFAPHIRMIVTQMTEVIIWMDQIVDFWDIHVPWSLCDTPCRLSTLAAKSIAKHASSFGFFTCYWTGMNLYAVGNCDATLHDKRWGWISPNTCDARASEPLPW